MEALWGRTGAEAEKAAQKLGVTFHTSQVASYFVVVFGKKVAFYTFCQKVTFYTFCQKITFYTFCPSFS